jgi:wyosine [tRNA(Phe)-imidazoG37] synthetase (radical SAM superfamily)
VVQHQIAFGPIPSRRLGRSLGVNTIPPKHCSYACRYCQVGRTSHLAIEPRAFFEPAQVRAEVAEHLDRIRAAGQDADVLSIVPDGEPTLDAHLGETIEALQGLGLPVAVITNASLLHRPEVRDRLRRADVVSVKVDTVLEPVWHRVDAPHRDLVLAEVLAGIRAFAAAFEGRLLSETMLLAGLNDTEESLIATADFLAEVGPDTAFLAVPVRPPAVAGTRAPDEAHLVRAHEAFAARLADVELLLGHEVGTFAHTGDALADLLAITAVHPMREVAVRRLLDEDGASWQLVERLLADGTLRTVDHAGTRFLLRPVVAHATA